MSPLVSLSPVTVLILWLLLCFNLNTVVKSLRSGPWSGMSRCPTRLPASGPPTCLLRSHPDPTCSTASPADWKTTGTLRLKVAYVIVLILGSQHGNMTPNPNSEWNIFGVCVCVSVCSEPPKVEEPEVWKEQQLSTLELFIQTHNKNPVQRVSPNIIFIKPCTCSYEILTAWMLMWSH